MKQIKVVGADIKVDQSSLSQKHDSLVKILGKDGALVTSATTSEQEERDGELVGDVGNDELVGDDTRVRHVVDLGKLILPPLLLLLVHLAGLQLTTFFLISVLSIICLVEYIC